MSAKRKLQFAMTVPGIANPADLQWHSIVKYWLTDPVSVAAFGYASNAKSPNREVSAVTDIQSEICFSYLLRT